MMKGFKESPPERYGRGGDSSTPLRTGQALPRDAVLPKHQNTNRLNSLFGMGRPTRPVRAGPPKRTFGTEGGEPFLNLIHKKTLHQIHDEGF